MSFDAQGCPYMEMEWLGHGVVRRPSIGDYKPGMRVNVNYANDHANVYFPGYYLQEIHTQTYSKQITIQITFICIRERLVQYVKI